MEIQYFNRKKGIIEVEKVYGESGIKWLYESSIGSLFANYLSALTVSRTYGSCQDWSLSVRKIDPFIKKFDIQMEIRKFSEYAAITRTSSFLILE